MKGLSLQKMWKGLRADMGMMRPAGAWRPSAVIVFKNGMSLEEANNYHRKFVVGFPLSTRICANEQFLVENMG
jgi:hypothetical protein